ncbi:hypothetical protein [Thiohalobacter thiocyanaticus]|uniref:Uncharacterized protein n=1 Tax=Thiohalobacter thiocyanaticus TaxID=585455 RepID=A0A426QGC1_9GAMM|nr:hypothetical protein [Thiohalobacter thiocyanaticus]RRQ20797.1 hypothetical protein D6C00_01595 [Thiohalobacter thiocyanaticus]
MYDSLHRKGISLIYALGVLLSFVSALVPQPAMGFELAVSVLLAGLLPYVIHAFTLPFLQGMALSLPALVLVAVHAWLVVTQRVMDFQGYADGRIYSVPLVLTLVMIGLLVWALRKQPMGRPWGPQSRHSLDG